MQTLTLLTLTCVLGISFAQYDSPTPPRPIIPGAIPVGAVPVGGGGGARPVIRRRPQAQQVAQELPPPARRISAGGRTAAGPARRLPSPPLLEQSLVSSRPSRPIFNEPVIRAPQPPPAPVASILSSPIATAQQQYSPQPIQQISPRPVIEENEEEEVIPQVQHIAQPQPQQVAFRPAPIDDLPVPTRQQYHRPAPAVQSVADEEPTFNLRQSRPQPQEGVRQPSRQSGQERSRQQPARPVVQQQYNTRQQQAIPRPANRDSVEQPTEQRSKKPEVQNLRKYRQDNEDGSITWGFENDDGTFKEETIGTDCITRGKYGYVDPDGVRREYSYQSGIPCDKRDELPQGTNEGYIDYTNNKYVLPNGDAVDLDNMVKNKARKPNYKNH